MYARRSGQMGVGMEIRVSVRQLVEFILREGSIDNRKSGGADTAMQEGSRIHRMIQRRMGSEYYAEVGLMYTWSTPDYDIIIEGRADGIIDRNWGAHDKTAQEQDGTLPAPVLPQYDKVVVDEIKGTYRELRRIQQPIGVHLAQAKCYAFMYAQENHLEQIGVRMTYCNMETEELKYFHEDFAFDEIKRWFDGILAEYKKWADFQFSWNAIRTESIKKLPFPFPYREGQKELVTYVYQTIYHKESFSGSAHWRGENDIHGLSRREIHGRGNDGENILSHGKDDYPHCCGGLLWTAAGKWPAHEDHCFDCKG